MYFHKKRFPRFSKILDFRQVILFGIILNQIKCLRQSTPKLSESTKAGWIENTQIAKNILISDELATAIRNQTNLKFGLYHSLYEWFNPLYLDDKATNFTKSRFVDFKTGPELYELVRNPKIPTTLNRQTTCLFTSAQV